MIAGFRISKIVLVQSLERDEVQTGRILSEYISALTAQHNVAVPVEFVCCTNYVDFVEIIHRLTEDARQRGEIPLLHVECHGSPKEGLEFANGSTLSWPDLANGLVSLNVACQFNLLAVFSACFGGYFLGQMGAVNPAPCYGMVAPTETVDPAEILQAFRSFYDKFLRTLDAGKAVAEIARTPITNGHWFGQVAEVWFERLLIDYVKTHCSELAARQRVKSVYRKLPSEGYSVSMGNLKRRFRQTNRQSVNEDLFNLYFMTDRLPENHERFNDVKVRVRKKLDDLLKTGNYAI